MTLAQLPYFYLRVETIIERPVDGLLPLKAKTQVHSQQVPSPNGSGFHSMAGVQRIINDFGGQENGLQFMNDKWNDTILNGNDFTLKWNRTIDTKKAILGVFRVTYPSQGVVVYESLENITNCLQPTYCKWKAEGLGEDLYSFWLSSDPRSNASFAISPPWTAKQPKVHSFTWAAPFLVPKAQKGKAAKGGSTARYPATRYFGVGTRC
ncbi:hypothetical protein NQ176_g7000 [Zarea fungicola]|uniref:Uncharacterized protein n=1 Tax=Zarea fungicola TaxID=93591 RepID=A0ACC1N2L5_9HYPO|nr:hypothetical protein NQ176_g7000 [Lecanicillium fungicola]